MSIRSVAVFCLVFAAPAFCQSAAEVKPQEPAVKIIRVQGDPRPIVELVKPGSNAIIQWDSALGVIVLRGSPSSVASAERVIQELESLNGNTQSRDIELIFHVLGGVPADGASARSSESQNADLAPVYKQLHGAFPFKSYQVLSTVLMRSGQGTSSSTEGMMKSPNSLQDSVTPGSYKIEYDSASLSGGSVPVIHLKKLHFSARIPYVSGSIALSQTSMRDVGVETDVDLRDGQKVVVGTSNIEPAGTTLFIVVTARLL